MKKFYKHAAVVTHGEGYAVALDGRMVKTPGKQDLVLPTDALARAVADEWNVQETDIVPASMPHTQLSNTAIDRVVNHRHNIIEELTGYAHTDLICYREDMEKDLIRLQDQHWQPVIDWLAKEHGIDLQSTDGIIPITQSAKAIEAIKALVSDFTDYELTAFHECVKGLGSIALALALVKGFRDIEACWEASILEQSFQEKTWGTDAEVADKRSRLKQELVSAMNFWHLVQG